MRWLDVAGPPGAGKSTLCNPLWGHKAIDWDGHLPPAYWRPFLDEVTALFLLIRGHPTLQAALRMNNRSLRKMATVSRMDGGPYIQTGLVQRGLGFGWRLQHMGADINLIRRYFWWMPVSLGVVFLEASPETVIARNRARAQVPETAHENRDFMVPLMLPAIEIAKEVLRARGVPVLELDVERQSPDDARAELVAFANQEPRYAPSPGPCGQIQILSPPAFWQ